MARGGEEAAHGLAGAQRGLARPLRGGACLDELALDALSAARIPDGRGDERTVGALDGAQADFDRNHGAVAAQTGELQALAHRLHVGPERILVAVRRVPLPERLGHQAVDVAADELRPIAPEEAPGPKVGEKNRAGRIRDDHRIRGALEREAGQVRRSREHGPCISLVVRPDRFDAALSGLTRAGGHNPRLTRGSTIGCATSEGWWNPPAQAGSAGADSPCGSGQKGDWRRFSLQDWMVTMARGQEPWGVP